MNILMVGPSLKAKGGVASVANNFVNEFNNEEIELVYFDTYIEGSFNMRLINYLKKLIKYIAIKKKMNIEIIHIHMVQGGSFYRKSIFIMISKIMGVKTIVHLHASQFDIFYNKSNSKKFITKILNMTDKIVVLSDTWKKIMSKITTSNIEVVQNAVRIDDNFNDYTDKSYITMFGRLGKRKGTYDLLEVLSQLYKEDKYKKYTTLLCGDGDIEEIKLLIDKLKIDNYVKVRGWVDGTEKKNILENSYLNLLPSYNEGMPMAILETMAYGIPNIATNVGGIPEVVEDNVNGFLIKSGDKEDLLKKLKLLLNNENIRKEFSEECKVLIENRFGLESYFEKWIKIYNEII